MGLTIVTNKGSGLQSELRPDVNTIAILVLVYVATSLVNEDKYNFSFR